MRKNGFTLIELLAVIVILAIIALIATPIILGIINDAREKANERSVELYAKAIQNTVAKTQLNSNEAIVGTFTTTNGRTLTQTGKTPIIVEYDGKNIVCSTIEIYSNGKIYLEGCGIGSTGDYKYGTKQEETPDIGSTQVFKPQYYTYYTFELSASVGDDAPTNPSTKPPIGKTAYIGYDVSNGKISALYACANKGGNEYCLKGLDNSESTFNENNHILLSFPGCSIIEDSDSGCVECSDGSYNYGSTVQLHSDNNGWCIVAEYAVECGVQS